MNPSESRRIEAEWIDVRKLNAIQLFTQSINVAKLVLRGYPAAVIRLAALKEEEARRRALHTSPAPTGVKP